MKRNSNLSHSDQANYTSLESLLERGRSLHSEAIFASLKNKIDFIKNSARSSDKSFAKGTELKGTLHAVKN